MLYRAILVHVLDLLMNVANQPKALKKRRKKKIHNTLNVNHGGTFCINNLRNPFEYLMWKLFVVMLH